MSSKSSAARSNFNLPLALLWLVAVVAGVVGYVILTSSNAAQAAFYAKQSADYGTYFQAQSGSFLGSILIGAGVLGVMIALASHTVARRAALPTRPEFSDEDLFLAEAGQADVGTSTTDAPVAASAPVTTASPASTDTVTDAHTAATSIR
ncbi:hypothetical protein [Glaciibacter sp. 2TAF33]|uniref:hypothetical protein n=1 Tax=Glaciibacter sp. 2TAF33 TaxID=3233015 RepID=UPI003F8E7A6D